MTSTQPPESEKSRLESLDRLEILDTPRERVFDRIVFLAAAIFRAPIAAISMIAETRQWLKAHVGDLPPEIPREVSFCEHVIAAKMPVVVEDARADPRFKSNPLVTAGPKVRFYAGVPISGPDGQLVATLCIFDVVPRTMDAVQLRTLIRIGDDITKILQRYPAVWQPRVDRLDQVRPDRK